MKILLKITFFFLGIVVPLSYFSNTLDPALTPRFLTLTLYIAVALLALLFSKHQLIFTKSNSILFLLVSLFILSGMFSSFGAIALPDAIFGISKHIGFLLFLLIITQLLLFKYDDTIQLLIKAVVLFTCIGILGGFYHLYKEMLIGRTYNPYWITSLFTNKNLFSSILLIVFPFNLFVLLTLKNEWKYLTGFTISGSFIFILILLSRSTWLGFTVFLSLFSLSILLKKVLLVKLIKKEKTQILIGALLCILLFIPYIINQQNNITSKFIDKSKNITTESNEYIAAQSYFNPYVHEPGSVESRTLLWKKSVLLFKEHPVLGVGVDNWRVQFGKVGIHDLDYITRQGKQQYQQPHNDFISVLTEQGVVGFLFFLCIVIYIAFVALSFLKQSKNNSKKLLVYLLCAMLPSIAIVSFFDFPKDRIEHPLFVLIAIAIMCSAAHNKKTFTYKISAKTNQSILLALLVITSFLITTAYKRIQGESKTLLLMQAKNTKNYIDVISYANKARNYAYSIDPVNCSMYYHQGLAYFELQQIDSALTCYLLAEKETPYHIHNLNNIATCYVYKNQLDKAEEYYLKTLSVSKDYEDAEINLAAIYYNQGKYKQGYEVIKVCNPNSNNKNYKPTLEALKSKVLLHLIPDRF